MSYRLALEKAGVVVKEYTTFGSYQGTWIALLEDGRIVEGSYGSCSGCDAWDGEFGYYEGEIIEHDGKYYRENRYWDEDEEITKEEAEAETQKYWDRVAAFGQSYLNGAESFEEVINRYIQKCNDEYAWEDDKEILEWLKSKTT